MSDTIVIMVIGAGADVRKCLVSFRSSRTYCTRTQYYDSVSPHPV